MGPRMPGNIRSSEASRMVTVQTASGEVASSPGSSASATNRRSTGNPGRGRFGAATKSTNMGRLCASFQRFSCSRTGDVANTGLPSFEFIYKPGPISAIFRKCCATSTTHDAGQEGSAGFSIFILRGKTCCDLGKKDEDDDRVVFHPSASPSLFE